MQKSIVLILFLFFGMCAIPMLVNAQSNKFTISGSIKDVSNGEELPGTSVSVKEIPGTGAITNQYGFYSLTLPAGNYTLVFSFIGYEEIIREIVLDRDLKISVELKEDSQELAEIVVEDRNERQNIESVEMSKQTITMEEVKKLPALFGEVDVLRTLTLMPGVQNVGEGTTGLFIRGGANDQNLMLLDDAPVYNASHLLGFFSVFNPDAVRDMTLYKGGIPAQYGGRLSSIIDIRMKNGNDKNFEASGGLGSISSRLTLEGPIAKDKASFIVSGRRTYADLFLKLSPDEDIRNNTLYFYDFNAKVNWRINDNNRVFLSGYFGRDVFRFGDNFGIDWGNATGTLRWNHIFNSKLFLNTTLIYSNFDYGFLVNTGSAQNFNWKSSLNDIEIKFDFDYFINPNNTIVFGATNIFHQFRPAEITIEAESSIFEPLKLDNTYALEQAFYIGNEQRVNDKLSLQYGLRYSLYQNVGPGRQFVYGEGNAIFEREIIDTIDYKRGEFYSFYHGLEPRFSFKYSLGQSNSIKGSYNRTRQYIQTVASNTAGLPFDRWIGSNNHIEPQIGDQFALGYFHNLARNQYELSAEVYYRDMRNQLDVLDGANVLLNNSIEDAVSAGNAWAYGIELLARRNIGKLTGWVSYTWSKVQRQIPEINFGNPYSPRYDRRHDFAVVASYQLSERVIIAGNFVYTTGAAVSFPIARYEKEGTIITLYDDANRNGDRMPDYHRMDISLTLDGKYKPGQRWKGSWNFSVYNLYNRMNPFTITFREKAGTGTNNGQPAQMEAVQNSLFGIIPSVTYNFRFM
ncbi:MAG: TonB-dependent receptor [Bernardetiaceae bacterium]|nr:TonB-dependent receptor [Bernardetiaceae bacterium]